MLILQRIFVGKEAQKNVNWIYVAIVKSILFYRAPVRWKVPAVALIRAKFDSVLWRIGLPITGIISIMTTKTILPYFTGYQWIFRQKNNPFVRQSG